MRACATWARARHMQFNKTSWKLKIRTSHERTRRRDDRTRQDLPRIYFNLCLSTTRRCNYIRIDHSSSSYHLSGSPGSPLRCVKNSSNAMASSSSGYSFTSLPTEIIEEIFYHIPMPDLLRNTSLVCKHWHAIIATNTFSAYRKNYYKYKIDPERTKLDPFFSVFLNHMADSPYLQDGERINNSVRFFKRPFFPPNFHS